MFRKSYYWLLIMMATVQSLPTIPAFRATSPTLLEFLHITEFDFLKHYYLDVRIVIHFTWLCRPTFNGNGKRYNNADIQLLSNNSGKITSTLIGKSYEN